MSEVLPGPSFTPKQILDDAATIARFHDAHTCRMLADAARYLGHILTKPDPMLGRPGAVCPFVGAALLDGMITLSVLPMRTADAAVLRRAALAARTTFLPVNGRVPSRAEALRAVIILLPQLEAEEAGRVIESVQKALKPEMIASGLMIGEFFPGCTAPGLNNPEFRPADTAFAFLAIRRMTAADLPFLIEDAVLLDHYLARFGEDGRRRLNRLRPEWNAGPAADDLHAAVLAQAVLSGSLEHHPIHAG